MGADSHNQPQGTAASSSLSSGGSHIPATSDGGHSQPEGQQQFGGLLPQQQKGPEPSRNHPQGRQAQETQIPQYKLQAKITGLERTGRKDPILRFDVHVRTLLRIPFFTADDLDQSAKIPYDSVPRCPANPFRIC